MILEEFSEIIFEKILSKFSVNVRNIFVSAT